MFWWAFSFIESGVGGVDDMKGMPQNLVSHERYVILTNATKWKCCYVVILFVWCKNI